MDLFGRAKKAMGGFSAPPPPKPQYFRIRCPEGHLVEGRRNEAYQALRCPDCGEGVFVLPASPLPEPKLPANRAPRPSKPVDDLDAPIPLSDPEEFNPSDAEPVDEVEWVDEEETEVEPEPVPAAPVPDPAAPVAEFDPDLHLDEPRPQPRPAAAPTRPRPDPKQAPARPATPRPERPSLAVIVRRNRHVLLVLLVVAAIGLAVANRYGRIRRAELPKIYERGKTEGLAALDRGEFPAAKELLREAAAAIRSLGGDPADPDVEAVLHGADEAAIYADLARIPLDELVEKRARAGSAEDWASEFDTYHKGQAVVFQVDVTATPADGSTGYQIDYRIGFGGGPTPAGRGRVDLSGFKLIEDARPKKGDRLSFGARLASVEFDADRNEYAVRLQPDSGVFLRHDQALTALQVGVPHEAREDEK